MRPISYVLGLLLILAISAIIFGVSYYLAPVDTTLGKATLAGIVIVAVAGFLSRLPSIVGFVDKFIDGIGGGSFSHRGYKKKYLDYIFYRHRNFDVKGLSTQGTHTLELEQVFVELSMAPRPVHEVSSQLLDLPEELQTGVHSIWSYLREDNGEYPDYAIIGLPGSGKTTLLKHMALMLAGRESADAQLGIPDKLPVLIFLRDLAGAIAAEKEDDLFTLEEAIQLDLRKRNAQAPAGWLAGQLNNGNCLVMLDGLDEVADAETRMKVVRWVERQFVGYARCPFLITSRPHGYRDNRLEGVTVLEIRPFNSEQQKRFVNNWYLANELQRQKKDDEGVRLDAQEGADDLLRRLYTTPNLADLAVNPLLLTMIATVHHYRSALPGRRVELYAEIFEVFLGKRQQTKGLMLDLTPAQRQRVLQSLAWDMMERELREIDAARAQRVIKPTLLAVSGKIEPELFLRTIENESGLLMERESGEYAFAHLTFQEYLAASHARDQAVQGELLPHVADSWWYETILLYAAQADASAIVETCLGEEGLPQLDALRLAMDCADEAREVNEATRQKLDQILEEALEGDDKNLAKLTAQVQLERRLKKMVRIDERRAIDTGLVTHAEYQLFLDHKRAAGENLQPDHWNGTRYPEGMGNSPVVGVRPSDAERFCVWLGKVAGEDIVYRLPTVEEATEVPVEPLASDEPVGFWAKSESNPDCIMAEGQPPAIQLSILSDYHDNALDHAIYKLDIRLSNAYSDELDQVSYNDLYRALASAVANALDCARDRDLYVDLDRALDDRVLGRARTLDRILIKAIRNAHDFDRALNLDRVRTNAFALIQDSTSAHGHAYDLDLDHDPCLANAFSNNLALATAFAQALARSLDRAVIDDLNNIISSAIITSASLIIMLDLINESSSRTLRRKAEFQETKYLVKDINNSYTDLFVELCILQERRRNRIAAFEGIRLMQVRVSQKDF